MKENKVRKVISRLIDLLLYSIVIIPTSGMLYFNTVNYGISDTVKTLTFVSVLLFMLYILINIHLMLTSILVWTSMPKRNPEYNLTLMEEYEGNWDANDGKCFILAWFLISRMDKKIKYAN